MRDKIKVVEDTQPGVIASSLGNGHWAYGLTDVEIDGERFHCDERYSRGIHANPAMRMDPHLKDISLQELAGCSIALYGSKFELVSESLVLAMREGC